MKSGRGNPCIFRENTVDYTIRNMSEKGIIMSERYEKLYALPGALNFPGAPVQITAGVLMLDHETGECLVQLKLRNLSGRCITSASVTILPESGEAVRLEYGAMQVENGEFFGNNTAAVLPELATPVFTAQIDRVTFADGTAWENTGEQQQAEADAQSALPDDRRTLAVKKLREKQAKTEKRKQSAKKAGKVALIVVCAVLVLGAAGFAVKQYGIPAYQNMRAYQAAEALLDDGTLEAAENAFLALGDYRDSASRALDCRYAMAERLLEQGEYGAAISVWEALGDYSDSAERVEQALTAWKDADYQAALQRMQAGDWLGAAADFDALGDYRDAAQQSTECIRLQNEHDYAAAKKLLDNGSFEEAMTAFQKLGDYADAREQSRIAAYQEGCRNMEAGQFDTAARYFRLAESYSDAQEKLLECTYQFGCESLEENSFEQAIEAFTTCGDYEKAPEKLKEAKLGYVKANLDPKNETSCKYIRELVAEKYAGAQKVYEELFAWKVEIISFNNDIYSETPSLTTLNKYTYMCVHFRISGGDGGSTDIRTTITMPGGGVQNIPFRDVQAGESYCAYAYFLNPGRAPSGTLTFRAYINGKLVATDSVPAR